MTSRYTPQANGYNNSSGYNGPPTQGTTKPKPPSRSMEQARYDSPRANDYQENGYAQDEYPGYNEKPRRKLTEKIIPKNMHNGFPKFKGIRAEGESGRRGIHPLHFFKIIWKSSCTASKWVNILWPFVPAAIVAHFVNADFGVWRFVLAYIGMVPSANLLGFAGQELARKIPIVIGVILETFLGSMVELILFVVILVKEGEGGIPVVQAAILGSILANLLLCLGMCFFVGGLKRHEQTFHDAVSDVGSNLMLVAGMALVIPTAYFFALTGRVTAEEDLDAAVRRMSRATAIILLCAFCVYVYFQTNSHHGLFDDLLEADEARDADRHRDEAKPKLTLTESIIALAIALTLVAVMAIFLVREIPYMIRTAGLSDAFLGLILVPLVEKAAEHLTALDEAYDNQMNYALSHVLGASVQTALLNTPLIVLIGWGIKVDLTLQFNTFDAIILILAILVVGGFLRDGKSNYLEGSLCVFVYILIAVAAFFYPNEAEPETGEGAGSGASAEATAEMVTHAIRSLL